MVLPVNDPIFQFLLVRLKDYFIGFMFDIKIEFQFLLVRLKV